MSPLHRARGHWLARKHVHIHSHTSLPSPRAHCGCCRERCRGLALATLEMGDARRAELYRGGSSKRRLSPAASVIRLRLCSSCCRSCSLFTSRKNCSNSLRPSGPDSPLQLGQDLLRRARAFESARRANLPFDDAGQQHHAGEIGLRMLRRLSRL
jgi:hypothetical protein